MKARILSTLLLTLPATAFAHPGGVHSHPEEMIGWLLLAGVVVLGLVVKNRSGR